MLKKLDMNGVKPFRKMDKTVKTREINDKRVTWPFIEKTYGNNEIQLRVIEKKDISEVSELWKKCYGELYGSSLKYDWVLYPERYEETVALRENWETDKIEKNFCMVVWENVNVKKIVGAWALWKDDRNLQIEFSIGIADPDFKKEKNRETSLIVRSKDFINLIEKESGAEYLTSFCETWHNKTQYLCFKQWGFKIAGIFPGQYTRWNGDQNEYRGCEVHFYKFLGDCEKYITKFEEWSILPEFKKIWDALEEVNKLSEEAGL